MKPQTVQLGEVCKLVYGEALKEENRCSGKIPVYGSNGVVGWHDKGLTEGATIIIGRKGSIGEINWSNGPCFPIDTTYYVEKTVRPCDLRWLYYTLLKLDLTRLNKSAAVPGLNRDDVYEQHIPFPDVPEQERIIALLDQADRLRRTRRYALELTDTFLPASFRQLFGPRLQSGPFRALGELVKITGGGTPERQRPEFYQGRIPWLTSKDMKGDYIWDTEEHITEKAIEQSATRLVPADSILVVVKSKVLMHRLPVASAKVPLCHGQDIKSIQCSGALQPAFVRFVLKYHEKRLLRLARGANTEGLTLPMLEELPVPAAPPAERERFAELVTRHERLCAAQREALRQAEHLFATLLDRAFTGVRDAK